MSKPVELVEARTLTSKTFDLGGRKRRVVCSTVPIHYDDNGELRDVVATIETKGNDLVAEKLPFLFKLDGIGYYYESRRGGNAHVRLVEIDGKPFDRAAAAKQIDANKALFVDIVDGIDVEIYVGKSGVRVFTKIKTDEAPRRFLWQVTRSKDATFVINFEATGYDANRKAEILNTVTVIEDKNGVLEQTHEIEWTGRVKIVDPVTRIPSWGNDYELPITIDPDITEEITANGNDGSEFGGNWNNVLPFRSPFNNRTTSVGCYYDLPVHGGWRFEGVNIPVGATIDLANFKVTVYAESPIGLTGQDSDGERVLRGADVDDAAAWSNTNGPSDQTSTSATSAFPRIASGTRTVDVTAIIQEIVDRAGWASGNSIALYSLGFSGPISGFNHVMTGWEDSSWTGTDEPLLEIDYTEAPPPSTSMIYNIFRGQIFKSRILSSHLYGK